MKLNKTQTEITEESVVLCTKILMKAMEISNIPNFIETIVVDEKTGVRYKLKFEKL
tara:strand:- start:318 stop:485 length:168 start_codon:yes stop_codon:yes gene_type:complete